MTYSKSKLWQMFINHTKLASSEDIRHINVQIEKDRYQEGLHDSDLRSRVEKGNYGSNAKSLWETFNKANE